MSKFKSFIQGLLGMSNLSTKYVNQLTSESNMIEYTRAFTTKGVNPDSNYEFYEILGDSTTNKIVVWYFTRRFPDLFLTTKDKSGKMGPVAIMARLKIDGVSKKSYSKFAGQLGFWDHIIASPEERPRREALLEDTFESFIGCTEWLVDTQIKEHSGYSVAYEFMKKIMDKKEIHLNLNDLYDKKSLINMEMHKLKRLGYKLEYVAIDKQDEIGDDVNQFPFRFEIKAKITKLSTGQETFSKTFSGNSKPETEQKVAGYLLETKMLNQFK